MIPLSIENKKEIAALKNEKSIKEVNYADYVSIKDTFTGTIKCYKMSNLVFLSYDLQGDFKEGETVLGSITSKLVCSSFGSARVTNSNFTKTYPATLIATSSGNFRIMSMIAGVASAGQIILLVNE